MSDDAPRLTVLPPNSSLLEAGLDLAFDKLLERIAPPFPELMNAAETPAEFLPYLAADRGVSEWSASASEAEKRETVASAWELKRLAGTRRALALAVESLGMLPDVLAWHGVEPKGAPYTLRITARAQGVIDEEASYRLGVRLGAAKAERDVLSVRIVSEVQGRLYYGAAVSAGSITTIYPYSEPESEVRGALYYTGALVQTSIITVYPQ